VITANIVESETIMAKSNGTNVFLVRGNLAKQFQRFKVE
jgi:hypothetical protein